MKQPYRRSAKVSKVIKKAMADRDIINQKMLSEYSGISDATLSKKMNGSLDWSFEDFKKMDKPLHFSEDDWIKIGKAFGLQLQIRAS